MRILILFLILLISPVNAYQMGEYRYSKYIGLQQQLQTQRMRAIRQQQLRRTPTSNIKYPTSYNPYPNIQKGQNYPLTRSQRYSSAYYDRYARY